MIASEKSHHNLSDYTQFLFKQRFEVKKLIFFSGEKMRNSIMLTRFPERIFNPMRYTGCNFFHGRLRHVTFFMCVN